MIANAMRAVAVLGEGYNHSILGRRVRHATAPDRPTRRVLPSLDGMSGGESPIVLALRSALASGTLPRCVVQPRGLDR
jgi:hypothetical protein